VPSNWRGEAFEGLVIEMPFPLAAYLVLSTGGQSGSSNAAEASEKIAIEAAQYRILSADWHTSRSLSTPAMRKPSLAIGIATGNPNLLIHSAASCE
jgi:hypothetical protein